MPMTEILVGGAMQHEEVIAWKSRMVGLQAM
jgi:hypothetical protein